MTLLILNNKFYGLRSQNSVIKRKRIVSELRVILILRIFSRIFGLRMSYTITLYQSFNWRLCK